MPGISELFSAWLCDLSSNGWVLNVINWEVTTERWGTWHHLEMETFDLYHGEIASREAAYYKQRKRTGRPYPLCRVPGTTRYCSNFQHWNTHSLGISKLIFPRCYANKYVSSMLRFQQKPSAALAETGAGFLPCSVTSIKYHWGIVQQKPFSGARGLWHFLEEVRATPSTIFVFKHRCYQQHLMWCKDLLFEAEN